MQFKECDTLRILETNEKISRVDMNTLVYAADTRDDFLVQNYIQKQIIMIHGQNFIAQSQSRIEAILYYMTKRLDEDLYKMYSKSFDKFMESMDNDYDEIIGFNIIFIFYINISRRLLRQSADKYS